MPGPVNQFNLTPNLAQQAVKLQKAQQNYRQQVQPHIWGTAIGVPFSTHRDGVGWMNFYINEMDNNRKPEAEIKGACSWLQELDNRYKRIIDSIAPDTGATYMTSEVVTQKNAQLQRDVLKLTQERDSLLEDQQAAELRENVLRSGNTAISNHQIYLLGRPLRPASLPYLWTLSVLFIGMGVLILYMFFPLKAIPFDILVFEIILFFKDPRVWAGLFGVASIVILFLVLYITGVL